MKKYVNLKLDNKRVLGDEGKGLKRNRKCVVIITMQVRPSNCYWDKVTCVPTDMREKLTVSPISEIGQISYIIPLS